MAVLKIKGLEILEKNMAESTAMKITVGFQGIEGVLKYKGGATVADVAQFMEFGTENHPARAFLRTSIFESKEKIITLFKKTMGKVYRGKMTVLSAYEKIGTFLAGVVLKKMKKANSFAAALADATTTKKGHGVIFLESGMLMSSVSWAVRGLGNAIVSTGKVQRTGPRRKSTKGRRPRRGR